MDAPQILVYTINKDKSSFCWNYRSTDSFIYFKIRQRD